MPLTEFQRCVALIIARNRTPESHIAGGAVINRGPTGVRISEDLDIFHDNAANIAAIVAASADADAKALIEAGYAVAWFQRGEGKMRAEVTRDGEKVRLDWSNDSAFRFFPVQPDDEFGYCLHPADLATNKVLALAGRLEIRDFLDILLIDRTYLSLGAVMWAACGKDEGYTPGMLLDETNRHSRFQQSDLLSERLAQPIDLRELKRQWIDARKRAEHLFARLPEEELGCLYLASDNTPVTPDPDNTAFATLTRHRGSLRGAWPTIS